MRGLVHTQPRWCTLSLILTQNKLSIFWSCGFAPAPLKLSPPVTTVLTVGHFSLCWLRPTNFFPCHWHCNCPTLLILFRWWHGHSLYPEQAPTTFLVNQLPRIFIDWFTLTNKAELGRLPCKFLTQEFVLRHTELTRSPKTSTTIYLPWKIRFSTKPWTKKSGSTLRSQLSENLLLLFRRHGKQLHCCSQASLRQKQTSTSTFLGFLKNCTKSSKTRIDDANQIKSSNFRSRDVPFSAKRA